MAKSKKAKEDYEHTDLGIGGQYKTWFLDYASYVILERAVPAIEDGLKPVQRRILHAMKEMDDGRFNKVANIIGQSMQYHPHGDASIGDALVNLGQKDLLIETQGNWGDVRTGDEAAASRYIEARLSKFALEVAFNAKTTDWALSYDGRKNEPVTLPMKFPLLLAQGGLIALSLILIDEVDNAYGDTYSGAVSAHSLLPRWSVRRWGLAMTALCTALALVLPLSLIHISEPPRPY